MGEKRRSIIAAIKESVKKSGQSMGKKFYLTDGGKARVRMLRDGEKGLVIKWHDKYGTKINTPCLKYFNKPCPHCDNSDLRHRELFCYPLWNYEIKKQQILLEAANSNTPIPQLAALYEENGTFTDRDLVIKLTGKTTEKTYSVIPKDKKIFGGKGKVKVFTDEEIFEIIFKAYCDDLEIDDDDFESDKWGDNEEEDEGWE